MEAADTRETGPIRDLCCSSPLVVTTLLISTGRHDVVVVMIRAMVDSNYDSTKNDTKDKQRHRPSAAGRSL